MNHASNIKTPLFVIHGQNDPQVSRNEAEQIVATVRQRKILVWYRMAKDEEYSFSKKKNKEKEY